MFVPLLHFLKFFVERKCFTK